MKLKIYSAIQLIIFISICQNAYARTAFSKVSFSILTAIVNISKGNDDKIFQNQFETDYSVSDDETAFLKDLIKKNEERLETYSEEDLKAKFLFPLFSKISFDTGDMRDWYEWPLSMHINERILSGKADFMIAEGAEEPCCFYPFIAEFKQAASKTFPKNQLLAEMLVAMEKSETDIIRGAFIIGRNWNFVILKKVATEYKYFVSKQFDSLDFKGLKQIYVWLQAVKAIAKKEKAEKEN